MQAEFWAGKRVAITGAAGFIGSALTGELARAGALVIALIASDDNTDRLAGREVAIERVGDWTEDNLAEILSLRAPEIIFNLRSRIAGNLDSDREDDLFKINFEGVKELARAAGRLKFLRRFVHVGTIAEYGGAPAPFLESGATAPIGAYGRSKQMATEWLRALAAETGFPAGIARLSLVYGPGQKRHGYLIPNTISNCLNNSECRVPGGGEQTRDPMHAEDAVRALMTMGAGVDWPPGRIINFGLGREYRVREIVEMIKDLTRSRSNIILETSPNRPGENNHYWLSVERARIELGWEPKIDLKTGLMKTIAWYRENMNNI